jgi:hypothetical protein
MIFFSFLDERTPFVAGVSVQDVSTFLLSCPEFLCSTGGAKPAEKAE